MLTSIANVFAAGIFLAVALMDLLPEGNEILKDRVSEFDSLGYLMCITGYALILFVEKVLFDTHALIEHKHELDTRNNSVNH